MKRVSKIVFALAVVVIGVMIFFNLTGNVVNRTPANSNCPVQGAEGIFVFSDETGVVVHPPNGNDETNGKLTEARKAMMSKCEGSLVRQKNEFLNICYTISQECQMNSAVCDTSQLIAFVGGEDICSEKYVHTFAFNRDKDPLKDAFSYMVAMNVKRPLGSCSCPAKTKGGIEIPPEDDKNGDGIPDGVDEEESSIQPEDEFESSELENEKPWWQVF